MMKKFSIQLLSILSLFILTASLEAASTPAKPQPKASSTQEKYDIMHRDQVEGTDVLAIPFDESEVEDEEQIDLDERKDIFDLPHEKR